MSRVIIPEPNGKYDISSAERYGTIVTLSDRRVDPLSPDETATLFKARLKDVGFNPREDYICLTGHQLTTSVFLATVTSMFPCVRVLMFDARYSDYVSRVFEPGA